MTCFSEKQAEFESKKTSAAAGYPALWWRILSEWQRPETSDRAWLLYSANYLLRTAGIRWALDPLTLHQRLPSAPEVDISPLAALDYIVLTHRHADHLDLDLLRRLREFPIRWIIPEFLLEHLTALDLPPESVSIPQPLEPIPAGGLTLTPFDGLHWEADPSCPDGQRGVPALGYLAEFSGKRWLFPGDTRTYDASSLLRFRPVDGLVVHLWLGRGNALDDQYPLLESFGRFCLDLRPKRIIVTHLNEFGRPADEIWDAGHFQLVKEWVEEQSPCVVLDSVGMGENINL
jgi:L-ascorbate metabolism protein UlaG (beta-lactamase superfamily)